MAAGVQSHSPAGNAAPLARLDLYRLFAACFGQPSPERFAWLAGKEFRTLLRQLADEFGSGARAARLSRFSSYEAYEAAYLALFEIGVPSPPVPLLESVYTQRAVPQEIVLECVNFYELLGLRPSGSVFPADHLVTQLEFLAAAQYVRESKSDAEEVATLARLEADFLERHLLNWLPAARKKLATLDPPLFSPLLRLLCEYLGREYKTLRAGSRG